MSIYAQKCHLFAIECDSNLLDGKSHLGIIQLDLGFIKFSFLCDMNESSSRFGTPKTFEEEKDCLSILFQNLRLHEQMGMEIFENGKTKKRSRFAPFSQARTVQR